MDRVKSIVISIVIVILLILVTVTGTYAFFLAEGGSGDIGGATGNVDIDYYAPDNINTGMLIPTPDREKGIKSVARVGLKPNSVNALFNMYIVPTSLSSSLQIRALKWEVEGIFNGSVVYTNSGDFSEANENEPIKIVDKYKLNTTNVTTFNVYIWLDAGLIENSIDNVSFGAKITVDSVHITSEF